ncbi:MAG: hypothetical protein JNL72_10270 [Flavipsychrobacter sp.]|nr:hypothetical protein [Flavipsychrobacter sp.]
MRLIKMAVLFAGMLGAQVAGAQIVKEPAEWTVETKKTGADSYDIIFHLKLKTGWHIYSLTPGGDGSLIAPSFKLDNSTGVKLNGAVSEKGKMVKKKMEGIKGVVNYYSGTVDYTQPVTATGTPRVTGSYRYQVCTDEMCLPPKTKKFDVILK